jgi:ACS family D-galactonate transporter-like MFS transporter
MNEQAPSNRNSLTPALWIVLALLSISLLINYVDRSSISIAAPLIKSEFKLTATQLGWLFAAFSWTYAFFLIMSGWLADRYNANLVLAIGFAVWSVATLLTGMANNLAAFLILRLLLGMGESVAYPSYSRIVARHFPDHRRGLANSVIAIGMPGGMAVGTFTGAILMGRYGWRPFFVVLGLGTLLWLIPWLMKMPRGKGLIPDIKPVAPALSQLLMQRSLWGTCVGLFSLNFVLYFMFWLPTYLVQERHFLMSKVSIVGFVYLIAAVISPFIGWLSDRWIAAGATPTLARKTFMVGGQIICALCLLGCVVAPYKLTVTFLLLAGVGFGLSNSQTWAITQTLAGPEASGKWTGFQNFVANFAGILGPTITGLVVDSTGGFSWAFAITAAVGILGTASWIFVTGPLTQTSWEKLPSSILPTVSTGSP